MPTSDCEESVIQEQGCQDTDHHLKHRPSVEAEHDVSEGIPEEDLTIHEEAHTRWRDTFKAITLSHVSATKAERRAKALEQEIFELKKDMKGLKTSHITTAEALRQDTLDQMTIVADLQDQRDDHINRLGEMDRNNSKLRQTNQRLEEQNTRVLEAAEEHRLRAESADSKLTAAEKTNQEREDRIKGLEKGMEEVKAGFAEAQRTIQRNVTHNDELEVAIELCVARAEEEATRAANLLEMIGTFSRDAAKQAPRGRHAEDNVGEPGGRKRARMG